MGVRRAHPSWGPRKLRAKLLERAPAQGWPAPSTIGELLRRQGLSEPRQRLCGVSLTLTHSRHRDVPLAHGNWKRGRGDSEGLLAERGGAALRWCGQRTLLRSIPYKMAVFFGFCCVMIAGGLIFY